MNKQQKVELRSSLITFGFFRTSFSKMKSDGKYSETWTKGQDKIIIKWGPDEILS